MSTKITVNGVEYDSADAMPPDVRRTYEEMLAKFSDLAQSGGGVAPEVVQGQFGPVKYMTTVQKKFVVNGKTYENEESMPPDVRQAYELGMRAVNAGDPSVKKNEIVMSFQVKGPHFTFTKNLGGHSQPSPQTADLTPTEPTSAMPPPIEPKSAAGGLRMVLFLAACIAMALAVWFLARIH
jgi:hypothetical protein